MSPDGLETRIDSFLAKYTPAVEARLREARAELRAMFPRGFELVFDNYNALVFAIGPTEQAADAFISVAGYPKWVTLFFRQGADLHDPKGLLEGQGKEVRSIRLESASVIRSAECLALIAQAVAPHEAALRAAPALTTAIKTVVEKQRPRRPAAAKKAGGRSL
jgi:hypothetical protein